MTPSSHDLFLLTGATGQVGRPLVAQLVAAGHRVRVLTRGGGADFPPGVEVRTGDFTHLPEGLFDAVTAAFVFPADGAEAFVDAAGSAGVPRLVLLSSLAAALEHPRDHGSSSQLHHTAIEEAVRRSGTAWTILRPGTFANNLLTWAPSIRFTGGVSGPYPTSAQAPIHEDDVAAAAASALTRPGPPGGIHPMTGPEALARVDQLATIGEALGRPLSFTETSPDDFAAEMARYGVAPGIVTMLLDYWRDTVATPDVVRVDEGLLGRPPLTLAQWATAHAADFGI